MVEVAEGWEGAFIEELFDIVPATTGLLLLTEEVIPMLFKSELGGKKLEE